MEYYDLALTALFANTINYGDLTRELDEGLDDELTEPNYDGVEGLDDSLWRKIRAEASKNDTKRQMT